MCACVRLACVGITVVEGKAEEESKEEETRWVTPERLAVIISGSWFFRSGCRALRRAIGMIQKKKKKNSKSPLLTPLQSASCT